MKRILENNQDYFIGADKAQQYRKSSEKSSSARFANFLATLKKLDIKGRYLEIGSGPGFLTQTIAREHIGIAITAVDISPEMTAIANEGLPKELKTRVSFLSGDINNEKMRLDLGKFDLIYSTFSFHHWDDAQQTVTSLYSLLNPNGVIYLYDLKRVSWLYWIKSKSGFFKSIRAAYRPAEIKTMLDNLGINHYSVKTIFPFFLLSVFIRNNSCNR